MTRLGARVRRRRAPSEQAGKAGSARGLAALGIVAALLIGVGATFNGAASQIDGYLRSARDRMLERPASGKVVLVEIDAKSLARIDRWPWPRKTYADAIDRLRIAGADLIAFDVDLSAQSSTSDDAAMASALIRADGAVALPTFVQADGLGGASTIENLPAPAFRDHAFLTAVNIYPDVSGVVRDYPLGIRTGGVPRPSIAAMLAGQTGRMGESFTIDQSIDPATIPHYSFIDLLEGRVPAKALRGKRVLIGATAIELGDRYAVPLRGVIPGVVIQAQAAETLIQQRALADLGPAIPLILALLALIGLARARQIEWQLLGGLASGAVFGLTVFGMEALGLATMQIGGALIALACGCTCAIVFRIVESLDRARYSDAATGLGNARALAAATRRDTHVSIAALRIGRFAEIASLLSERDLAELVTRVADRVRLAAADGLVYRVEDGGLVWAVDSSDGSDVADRMAGLVALLRAPIAVAGRSIDVGASFGLAEGAGSDASAIASKALYAADKAIDDGRNWQSHSSDLDNIADRHTALLGEIDQALSEGQIWVAFQPKIALETGNVTGAEALVRWDHPTRGAISPEEFIPLFENGGDMAKLTLHVLQSACRARQEWVSAGIDAGVAVNVSASLLRNPAFVADMGALIAAEGIDPAKLTIEVTESASMADPEVSIRALERLRGLGVRISIDDYGTGQSTLTYLRQVPASEIKIDKSFVLGLLENRSDYILVRSTIQLAHELGFSVVAEGIESEAVAAELRALGCDTGQGWHFGRPVRSDAFMGMFGTVLAVAA